MRAIDTNVLARFILRDDEEQARRATSVLAEPVWVTITVWLELGWVLGKQLKLERDAVADALETVLSLGTVHTAHREALHWAADRFRAGADWADMLHLIAAADNAGSFASFDGKIQRQAGSSAPVRVDVLT